MQKSGKSIRKSHRFLRHMALFFCVSLLLHGFCGCETAKTEDAVNAETLLQAIEATQSTALPPCRAVLQKNAPGDSLHHLSQRLAALLYLGDTERAMPEYTKIADCRVRLSDSLSGCEIHILQGNTTADLPLLEALCRSRLEALQSRELHLFLQEQYEDMIAPGRVIVRGDYVFLLLVPDVDAAITEIDRLLT